ncbi:hypothetical protein F4803DRAFT_550761 [Xylaria telfairii]|nr:hypothetical protein F4803DRAFT_550761 [Xylaria telfairii]
MPYKSRSSIRPAPPSERGSQGSRSSAPQDQFLDRWNPRADPDHYRRVRLYRKRKNAVRRNHEAERNRSNRPPQSESIYSTDGSQTVVASSATDLSSPTISNIGSLFQDELDSYDDQIKSLQQGEWPAPPNTRGPALRLEGREFSQKNASDVKRWSLVEGFLYGGQSATLRKSDRVHPAGSYEIGVIFSAPHHTASSTDERWIAVGDPHNTATPFGVVHSKYRKMVVIKTFGEHCICLPVYSHNGQGFQGKTYITEQVSIRDAHDRHPEQPEGIHLRLLAVCNRNFRGKIVSGKSSVKLTEFCSHRYDAPATMEGKLEVRHSDSTRRLLDLVKLVSG